MICRGIAERMIEADGRAGDGGAVAHMDGHAVAECAMAAPRGVEFVDRGYTDHTEFRATLDQQADGHAPIGKVPHEIRRAIDRIDNPEEVRSIRCTSPVRLLAEQRISGESRREPFGDES